MIAGTAGKLHSQRKGKTAEAVEQLWPVPLHGVFDAKEVRARRLLQRLAWLAPEPIPESLLEVPVPGLDTAGGDLYAALAELESYSLVSRADDAPAFSVHRLVQEVTRRSAGNEAALQTALVEALG